MDKRNRVLYGVIVLLGSALLASVDAHILQAGGIESSRPGWIFLAGLAVSTGVALKPDRSRRARVNTYRAWEIDGRRRIKHG